MLSIGNLKLNSPLILAPLAGISDLPFRMIYRSLGSELAFTEMISSHSFVHSSKNTLKMIESNRSDRPLAIQLLGNDIEIMKKAIDKVSENRYDMVDLNAACPATKVASTGKGAGLMRDPLKLREILKLMVNSTKLPVTVKIRSGWDETSVNAVDVALHAEDAGINGLFIHGRTKKQRYTGTVDYDIIRKVKESLSIPVIASGDAFSPVLIKKMFDETGCDGVVVARGSFGNPWIFQETTEFLKSGKLPVRPSVDEVVRTMKKHLDANIAFHGEHFGVIRFRKIFRWYTKGMSVKELKVRAFQAKTGVEMTELIDEVKRRERVKAGKG